METLAIHNYTFIAIHDKAKKGKPICMANVNKVRKIWIESVDPVDTTSLISLVVFKSIQVSLISGSLSFTTMP